MRALFAIPLLGGVAMAQTPTRTLARPDAEYAEPFSGLAAVTELRDGRVVAADVRDKSLQVVDLRAGNASPVGREGAGPQEWIFITGLFGWKGDSVIANDMGNNRYLVIAPNGKPIRTFTTVGGNPVTAPAPGRGGRGAGPRISGFGDVHGVDAKGRIYAQELAITFVDGRIAPADSAPITRRDLATNKLDTIAYVNLAKSAVSGGAKSDGRGNQTVSVRIGGGTPYPAADDWTVFRDGTVAIVRVADYHVEFISPTGRRVVGRPVAYTPVRVGAAEKKEWMDREKNATRFTRTIGGSGGSAPPPPPVEEPAEWPAVKPPFGNRAAFAAPNGDLWVVRSRAAADKVPYADVFNPQGRLVGTVKFPERTSLIGLGTHGVYAVRTDDDDLQYLQRYPMQWTGCSPEFKEVCK